MKKDPRFQPVDAAVTPRFAGIATFMRTQRHDVSRELDIALVEADRVTSPAWGALSPDEVDGIVYDASGNPVAYRVLREHPGDRSMNLEQDTLPASKVVHYFMPARPEQSRGVPDLVPALPLFAQLRRYTVAVLSAAETAANFAGTVETDAPANGEADPVEPMDTIELEANSLLTLPAGWKMSQVKPEQPTTSYGEFKREILNEIARCLNMPFNVAAGNSSGYNYASGRLDHQTYFKSIRIDQAHMARTALARILAEWFDEAKLTESLVPPRVRALEALPHQWFWDGTEHVDPAKEATAQATRLANNTTTLASEFAKQGKDWEAELRQRARELALMSELGIALPAAPASQPVDQFRHQSRRLPPSFSISLCSSTRSSLSCMGSEMLSISSRNRVPPLAASTLPTRSWAAPVKAPFS